MVIKGGLVGFLMETTFGRVAFEEIEGDTTE